jgi:hypothetical protein
MQGSARKVDAFLETSLTVATQLIRNTSPPLSRWDLHDARGSAGD